MLKVKSEIRKDYLLNKYVIITPSRAKRPRDLNEQTILSKVSNCSFCPENIDNKEVVDKINGKKNWEVLSLNNIYPAVTLKNKYAYGAQEVIIETPLHAKELAELSENKINLVLNMYSKRTKALMKNKKLDYILCFKNQGSKAGASKAHAHSQVFATNIIPPELQEEANAINSYKTENHTCPYCDIIKKEMKSKRKIFEDKNVAVFAPYASEYHYEVWIFPKRHVDNITLLKPSELKSFSHALKLILVKLHSLNLSFNYFLHNVVSNKDQHLYIKIQPRDSIWAGIELGSGLIINSVLPETAAKFYKTQK